MLESSLYFTDSTCLNPIAKRSDVQTNILDFLCLLFTFLRISFQTVSSMVGNELCSKCVQTFMRLRCQLFFTSVSLYPKLERSNIFQYKYPATSFQKKKHVKEILMCHKRTCRKTQRNQWTQVLSFCLRKDEKSQHASEAPAIFPNR